MTRAVDPDGLLPLVSVIMPVRNEGKFITECLDAVMEQDYPPDRIEVFIVDGMSTDATPDIVRSYQGRRIPLRLLENPGKIVPKGMNVALAVTKGEIIVRVDGHCKIAPDYVRCCVRHIRMDHVDGVGGPVRTMGGSRTARVIALAMSSPFGVGGSAFRTVSDRTMLADTVPFPAYTRSIIERAGPYDEELVRNQDDEYNYRLRKLGAKILLAADVRSEYYSRSSIRSLWRQYYQYGYWKVRVLQKHPRQMKMRQFVPAAFVASLAIALATSAWWGPGMVGLLLIAGSYLAANLCAAFLTARRNSLTGMPLLSLAFATLHVSYGLGSIAGLVKFRDRWRGRSPEQPSPSQPL
jgi:glycosyltransferase involved in cell wall biosynthesis